MRSVFCLIFTTKKRLRSESATLGKLQIDIQELQSSLEEIGDVDGKNLALVIATKSLEAIPDVLNEVKEITKKVEKISDEVSQEDFDNLEILIECATKTTQEHIRGCRSMLKKYKPLLQ